MLLNFGRCHAGDLDSLGLEPARVVFIKNYQPAAVLTPVGEVAAADGLIEVDAVAIDVEIVDVVVAEECGDDIAHALPALELIVGVEGFIGRAGALTQPSAYQLIAE